MSDDLMARNMRCQEATAEMMHQVGAERDAMQVALQKEQRALMEQSTQVQANDKDTERRLEIRRESLLGALRFHDARCNNELSPDDLMELAAKMRDFLYGESSIAP